MRLQQVLERVLCASAFAEHSGGVIALDFVKHTRRFVLLKRARYGENAISGLVEKVFLAP